VAAALQGHATVAQRLMLELYLNQIEKAEREMAALEEGLAAKQSAGATAGHRAGLRDTGHSARAAQQVIAEVVRARSFPRGAKLASWVGVSPGQQERGSVEGVPSPKANAAPEALGLRPRIVQ